MGESSFDFGDYADVAGASRAEESIKPQLEFGKEEEKDLPKSSGTSASPKPTQTKSGDK